MSQARLEGKVGLFVVVGLVLVALLLLSFSKQTSVFTPTYEVRLKAGNVSGLKGRSGVLMSGVSVGEVASIDLAPGGREVTIQLKIRKAFPIPRESRWAIEQSGFLGDQYVAVYPSTNVTAMLQDHDEVRCEDPFSLLDAARAATGLVQRFDQTTKMLNEAIARLNQRVLDEDTLTTVSGTIRNLRKFSETALELAGNVRRIVDTNSAPVSQSVSNLLRFSDRLDTLVTDASELIATNRVDLSAAVRHFEATVRTTEEIARDLAAGKGVAGSLLNDEQLKQSLAQTLGNLATLSSNLNRHGLLFKPRPPKTEKPASVYPGKSPFK